MCNCGGGARRGKPSAIKGYQVTTPQGEVLTYLTALEAKREIRRRGGGTVRVLKDEPVAAAP